MVLEEFRLDGKIALVTGAATGLGQAMACALAEAGAVLALATRKSRLESTANCVTAAGRKPLIVRADLSQPAEREALIQQTVAHFGRIDILVNNAGITSRHAAEEYPLDDWLQVLDINVNSVFHLCQLVID
jgi:2-dehydro-3-deoxy-D-gluconate 5-dehydrogenase